MIRRTRMPRRSPSSRCFSALCAGSSWRRSTVAGSPSAAGGGDVRDGGGREETAASSGDDRSVRERRSVVRRRRTTGENNDVGGEGKHAAQVHLTAQPPEVGSEGKISDFSVGSLAKFTRSIFHSPWRFPCRRGTRVIISTPFIPVHVTFAHRVTNCTGSTDKERRLSRSTRNP